MAPVSLQARSLRRKSDFKAFVTSIVEQAGFLLSGDVKVQIEWYVHEQKRYETDASADTDNVIKPLLDALCGPAGIMIDDNQVQSVTCSWLDSYEYDCEKINITVTYSPDEFVSKEGLAFINMGNHICMPINETLSPDHQNIILNRVLGMIKSRDEYVKNGIDYYQAKIEMSVQRVFHKTRLKEFTIIDLEDKLESLKKS